MILFSLYSSQIRTLISVILQLSKPYERTQHAESPIKLFTIPLKPATIQYSLYDVSFLSQITELSLLCLHLTEAFDGMHKYVLSYVFLFFFVIQCESRRPPALWQDCERNLLNRRRVLQIFIVSNIATKCSVLKIHVHPPRTLVPPPFAPVGMCPVVPIMSMKLKVCVYVCVYVRANPTEALKDILRVTKSRTYLPVLVVHIRGSIYEAAFSEVCLI